MSHPEFKPHPISEIFPMMTEVELDSLAEDIKSNGLREPILVDEDGLILDGRNRLEACRRAGVDPEFETWSGDDPIRLVLSRNLHRRHLTTPQRAMVAARIANLGEGRPEKTASIDAVSQDDAGKQLRVSRATVQRAAKVIENGTDELIRAVEEGTVPINAATLVAQLPKEEQREVVDGGHSGIKKRAAELRGKRKPDRDAPFADPTDQSDPHPKDDTETQQPAPEPVEDSEEPPRREPVTPTDRWTPPEYLPPQPVAPSQSLDGNYRCIVIDPDWPTTYGGDPPENLPDDLSDLGSPDGCIVFLWSPIAYLPEAIRHLGVWGVEYTCTLTWVMNSGYRREPWMHSTRHILVGHLGKSATSSDLALRTSFDGPVNRRHKPKNFYEIVRKVSAAPRLLIGAVDDPEGFETIDERQEARIPVPS